jgi:5-methyltetrahydrofolate--homocysteine methyltransferase
VPDASRSVSVCSSLLSDELREEYANSVRADYDKIRIQHHSKKPRAPLLSIAQARANAFSADWSAYTPPAPSFIGVKEFRDYDLAAIAGFIDWSPFFQTWELSGAYPKLLQDPLIGEAARNVFAEGQAMLAKIIAEKWLAANAVVGLFPANSVGDDIEIYTDESRTQVAMCFHNLRQQAARPTGKPNYCLADFVAPKDSGVKDYIGAFAVTSGIGIEARVREFESRHDDYSAIMLKSLADRLAEAFAEHLHQRVRREFWGYAGDEMLDNEAMIREEYRGIRPAPGYPACPDHTEKGDLFRLLGAPQVGITLTESYAMWPAAAVSGFYFSHPESRYFAVGKIDRDQAEDYARRKGLTLADGEKWLAPALAYDTV